MTTLPQTLRRAAATASFLLVASLVLSSCGGGSTPTSAPTPTPEIKTETFTGTVAQGGSAYNPFTVVTQGAITATLTSLSPQSTITMGFGIGTLSGTTCSLITGAYSEAAKVSFALSGTIAAGSYCVLIYDIGNLSGPNDYVITVSHP
jgi:hypothetical protein